MAYAHLRLNNYDSVIYYQQKHLKNIDSLTTDLTLRKKFSAMVWGFSADLQLARKQYDSVLLQVVPNISKQRENKDVIPLMYSLLIAGKTYLAKDDPATSLNYNRELYILAVQIDNKQFLKDAAEQLSATFEQMNQTDSAFLYFRQYAALKDSMETAKFAGRTALYLAARQADNKIMLLQKDNERQGQLKNILIAGFILAVLFSIIITRNLILKRRNEKLRNEQEKSALKRKALELDH